VIEVALAGEDESHVVLVGGRMTSASLMLPPGSAAAVTPDAASASSSAPNKKHASRLSLDMPTNPGLKVRQIPSSESRNSWI
jgi:hypothetical protein